jgi:hypothetical protein
LRGRRRLSDLIREQLTRKEKRPRVTPQDEMRSAHRTPDDLDPRAKSTGHGKKTADKWNQ